MTINAEFTAIAEAGIARNEVVRAALRVLANERGDETGMHYDDDLDLARDELAIAARRLVDATNQLHRDQQPVGWTS